MRYAVRPSGHCDIPTDKRCNDLSEDNKWEDRWRDVGKSVQARRVQDLMKAVTGVEVEPDNGVSSNAALTAGGTERRGNKQSKSTMLQWETFRDSPLFAKRNSISRLSFQL